MIVKGSKLRILAVSPLIAMMMLYSAPMLAQGSDVANSLDTVVTDMTSLTKDLPHGNSKFWATTPHVYEGNSSNDHTALTAWGTAYEAAHGNRAKNTRVEVRDFRLYILGKSDRQWHMVQSSTSVRGLAYNESFTGNVSNPISLRTEPDGGTSAKPGGGWCFHFWPTVGRVAIPEHGIAGIFATYRAKLVVDDPRKPDDRSRAKFVADIGGDYWLNTHAQSTATNANNAPIATSRFKSVKKNWQSFNMTTLSANELAANPPPLE